jgi:integrase
MARISRRLGRLGVDWTDRQGKRRWKSFTDEGAARIYLGQKLIEAGRPISADPTVTMAEYAPRWLAVAAVRIRPTSLVRYRRIVERQILPGLGLDLVAAVTAARLRDWIAGLMSRKERPLARTTAAQVLEVVSQVLGQAQDDGIISDNPARGLAKKLRLTSKSLGRNVKAFTPAQLSLFLKTAETVAPEWYAMFYTLAMTGIRLGEAFGLRWGDVDSQKKRIRIERQIREDGEEADPKSKRGSRTIDVGDGLLALLEREHEKRPASDWILMDWPTRPTTQAVIAARNAVRYSMRQVLAAAKLPPHFTPHSFRHTFASIHLSRGEPVQWVSEQLGHETISITCDLYGRWMRAERAGAAMNLERIVSE